MSWTPPSTCAAPVRTSRRWAPLWSASWASPMFWDPASWNPCLMAWAVCRTMLFTLPLALTVPLTPWAMISFWLSP